MTEFFPYQQVKVVAVTQPLIQNENFATGDPEDWGSLKNQLTAEEFIAYTARVSNPGNQMNSATADRLVRYLIKNHHWSPFEMVSATLEIKTTRDIGRQILRHRSFAFQEFSQRYAVVEDSELEIIRETRFQDPTNRQKSLRSATLAEGVLDDPFEVDRRFRAAQKDVMALAMAAYYDLVKLGLAKEQARSLLLEGLTPTTMYMTGNLRSWIHWAQIRTDANTTQLEHVDIANKAVEVLRPHFPNIFKALDEQKVD